MRSASTQRLQSPQRGKLPTAAVGYAVWVNLPTSHYKSEIAQFRQTRQLVFAQEQKLYATDVSQNCYLDPTFSKLWGGWGAERGPAGQAFVNFNNYNSGSEPADKVSPQFQEYRKQMQAWLPKLEAAVEKPVFVEPAASLQLKAPEVYLGLRQVAQVLAFEAELEAAENKPDEAADKALLAFKLGHSLAAGSGPVGKIGIAQAIQATAFDPLYKIVVHNTLKPATLGKILQRLERDTLPGTSLVSALEDEIVMLHNLADVGLFAFDGGKPTLGNSVGRWSGLLGREVRLYDNDMYRVLEANMLWPEVKTKRSPSKYNQEK